MLIIRTVAELGEYVSNERKNGRSIGLVPTMGALHAGHISLVTKAVSENDIVLVSLFVNPTQFNNPTDLATYPRKEEDDFALLREAGASAVFAPSVEEIYPGGVEGRERHEFELGTAATVMEGKYRTGHFQVEIVACPIKRADDGLALSSRNALLTPEQRAIAPEIYRSLKASLDYAKEHSVQATHDMVVESINAQPELDVEYYEIVDGRTLLPVAEWEESDSVVGCITVYCGKIRLIDNIRYK